MIYSDLIVLKALLEEIRRLGIKLDDLKLGIMAKVDRETPIDKMNEPELRNLLDLIIRKLNEYKGKL